MPCSSASRPRTALRGSRGLRGFTLVEVVVLLAVGVLLVGLLIPALGASRDRARAIECSTRLQQLGVAVNLYLNDSAGSLPQVLQPDPVDGSMRVSPLLFGGKRGTLSSGGIDQFGVAERPLNRYVSDTATANKPDAAAAPQDIEAFHSPADRGGTLTAAEGGPATSLYDRFGTSYVLNDRLLRASADEPVTPTLIPREGGPMPAIVTPDRTWLLGSFPIHNYDLGVDRRMAWYGGSAVHANLLTADMHMRTRIDVPPGPVNTTDKYTFLPAPQPAGH